LGDLDGVLLLDSLKEDIVGGFYALPHPYSALFFMFWVI
jgi:hypothetical protein